MNMYKRFRYYRIFHLASLTLKEKKRNKRKRRSSEGGSRKKEGEAYRRGVPGRNGDERSEMGERGGGRK